MRWLARIRSERRCVAALEFALALPLMLMFFGGAADLGLMVWSQSSLANAVAQGAQYALLTWQRTTTVTQTQIQNVVQHVSPLSGVSASQTTSPGYYCVSTSATPATLTSSSLGATCSDGTAAAPFVKVVGSYTYTPLMPAFDKLANTTLTETIWVRLQ